MKKISFGKISLGSSNNEKSSEESGVISGFGKIETTKPEPEIKATPKQAPVPKGPQKHARSFNVDEMMAEINTKVSENQKELLIADPDEDIMEAMGFSGFGKAKAPPKKAKAPPPAVPKINKTKLKVKNDEVEKSDPEKPDPEKPDLEKVSEEKDEERSSSDEEGEEETIERSDILPISHEITLNHAIKAVSGLALDPAGSRLVTGSQDFDVKFWDFNAMDARFQSFRTIQPMENYHITSIEYSITGDQVLFCSGGPQPQILDRDGSQKYICRKGDQYIVDMTNTNGHVSSCFNAVWHPKDKNFFMTSSSDCTVRVWDVNVTANHKTCIKLKGPDRRKVSPSHSVYSKDGNLICVATLDGAISCYSSRGPFVRPKLISKSAHTMGTETSCLKFASDGNRLLSRGGDDTMKLWDLRKFTQPLHVANDLENVFIGTDCWFSPDEKIVMTGTSVKQGSGELVFYDAATFEEFYRFSVGESSVSKILWHPKLNQIVVGCSNGKVKMYYSPTQSFNGAKLCTAKARRRKAKNDEIPTGNDCGLWVISVVLLCQI